MRFWGLDTHNIPRETRLQSYTTLVWKSIDFGSWTVKLTNVFLNWTILKTLNLDLFQIRGSQEKKLCQMLIHFIS